MITEDYVSFEVAKLLKEKKFNEPCTHFYESDKRLYNDMGEYFQQGMKNSDHDIESAKGISAPTFQMALKWLREVHNIYLNINIRIILGQWSGYDISVYTTDNNGFLNKNISINLKDNTSYEKACEEAIKYCLTNLI